MAEKTFDKIFLEAVDEAFSNLGDSVRQAIYFHLENKFKITRNEIPNNIEAFAEGVEKIFGVGSRFLEILIMKKLYERIGKPLEWNENSELEFVNYVEAARSSFEKRKGKHKKRGSSACLPSR